MKDIKKILLWLLIPCFLGIGIASGFQLIGGGVAAVGGGFQTPSRVQEDYAYSNQVTFSGAVTSGNFLVAVIGCGGSSGSLSVSDSVNGAWTQAILTLGSGDQGSPGSSAIFYFPNTSAGTPTVTVTPTTLFDPNIMVAEYSGVSISSPLDDTEGQNSVTGGGASSNFDTGTGATVSQTHILLIGGYENYQTTNVSTYPNYTLINNDISNSGGASFERILTDGSGDYDFSGTMATSNNSWTVCVAAFKAAAQ